MQHALVALCPNAVLFPGASQPPKKGRSVCIRDALTIVGHDDFFDLPERIVFELNVYPGSVGVESIPNKFRNGGDRLSLRLSFEEILLYFNCILGHAHDVRQPLEGRVLTKGSAIGLGDRVYSYGGVDY